jgi:hypothetical protein
MADHSYSADVVVQRGVAGRAEARRAITLGMPPLTYPRQGSRRPTKRPRAAATGGVATAETCVRAAAKLRPSNLNCQRPIAARAKFPLFR